MGASSTSDMFPSQSGSSPTSAAVKAPLNHPAEAERDKQHPKSVAASGPGRPGWLPQMTFQFQIISIATASATSDKQQDTSKPAGSSRPDINVGKTNAVLLATLNFEAPNRAVLWSSNALYHVRARITQAFPAVTAFVFCNEQGATVPDQLDLNSYFASLNHPPTLKDFIFRVYVTSTGHQGPPTAEITAILKKKFCLKILRVLDGERNKIESSLDSDVFHGKNAATTVLHVLRGLVKSMSVDAQYDTFCLPDGTPVRDDTAIERYLVMSSVIVDDTQGVPFLPIHIKRSSQVALEPSQVTNGGYGGGSGSYGPSSLGRSGYGGNSSNGASRWGAGDQAVLSRLKGTKLSFTDRSGSELQRDKTGLTVNEMLNASDYTAQSSSPMTHANKLNENDWDVILKNCSAFYGWIIDFEGNKIVRAPHPAAFKLRKGLNLEKVKIVIRENLDPTPVVKVDSHDTETASSDVEKEKQKSSSTRREQPKLEPLQVSDVKEYMQPKPQGIPSFMITDQSSIQIAATQHEFSQSMATNHFDSTIFEAGASGSFKGVTVGAEAGVADEDATGSASSNKSVAKTLVANYQVSDCIENKIPRVTIFLPPEDLELTPELETAIKQIRDKKNISDLRLLQRRFGQIFCSNLVLGGCLQTTKNIAVTEVAAENSERNKFKADVGLSIGMQGGPSGSMKYSKETQDSKDSGTKKTDGYERLTFDATGGNTALATNPPAWVDSVAVDFNTWRVIKQTKPIQLVDVISSIEPWGEVASWFLQAVPKLSEYIIIPRSREIEARFKVQFDSDGLDRAVNGSNSSEKQRSATDGDPLDFGRVETYLSHNPNKPPRHVKTFVAQYPVESKTDKSDVRWVGGKPIIDVTTKLYQTTTVTTDAVFYPAWQYPSTTIMPSTKPKLAPTVPGIATAVAASTTPDVPGVATTIAATTTPSLPPAKPEVIPDPASDSYLYTVWRLEVPTGYSLGHNSLVTIKSLAFPEAKHALTMTVYRNAQGVFMPTISSSADPAYWRVCKTQFNSTGTDADRVKFGETIRLCWKFSDQLGGWRDYKGDLYGRRRFDKPAEIVQDALYLKAPFPRFEALNSADGMSLVLSSEDTTAPITKTFQLRTPEGGVQDATYGLYDLPLRFDYVGNNGSGDSGDYMNVVQAEHSVTTTTELLKTIVEKETQSAGNVMDRARNSIESKRTQQFDDLANSFEKGSPGDIVKNLFLTGVSNTPIGFTAKMFGIF
ncbi:hypothetical protein FHETE_6 [Fusarium heterosporum]|uniref:MACPF-like domain-containing protein n=1 Tax=Fusarium heterosporum TaxID=42747 RepID=A0A8H5U7N1_FUSHE|nr:hypothetical protein FHETE_6 [Fusarium heterosporum]